MNVTVDEVDLAIIAVLQRDPNASNKAIAANVEMSDVGVANRIRRLIENNVIRSTIFYDVDHLGVPLYCILHIGVSGRPANDVARTIASISDIQMVSLLLGEPQIIATFFAKDQTHIAEVYLAVARCAGVGAVTVATSMDMKKYMSGYGSFAVLRVDNSAEQASSSRPR